MEIKPQEKMNIREIRIGNIIEYLTVQNPDTWDHILVSPVTFGRLSMESTRFRGIELTPEWLDKLGFKKEGEGKYAIYHAGVALFGYWTVDGAVNVGQFIPRDIKHVHQLQNLYFALTGKELAIDNKSL